MRWLHRKLVSRRSTVAWFRGYGGIWYSTSPFCSFLSYAWRVTTCGSSKCFMSVSRDREVDRDLQLPPHLHASVVPYCSGAPEVQHSRLPAATGAVRILGINPDFARSFDPPCRFQKAIKKVRAVQRMRRNRGFAFSQTENGTKQDQARLIRAYDTSKSSARPSGY
jgi:hypothetical protein